MKSTRMVAMMFGVLLLGQAVAYAQSPETPPATATPAPEEGVDVNAGRKAGNEAPPATIRRGWETGADVYSGRNAENELFIGVYEKDQLLAFRVSNWEGPETPCALGVKYEYAAGRSRSWNIQPMVGGSLSYITSCSTEDNPPSPATRASTLVTGGIRIPVFTRQRVSASLKVLGFMGRRLGGEPAADVKTAGIAVGLTFHGW